MSTPIPTQAENPQGLHQRYIISKVDGSPLDEGAEYFVLRLDDGGGDPNHIKACREAVLCYARNIATKLPKLAQDLIERYGWEGKSRIYPKPIAPKETQ